MKISESRNTLAAVLLYHLIGDFLLAELLVREVAGRLGGLGGHFGCFAVMACAAV